jgi:surfeit locus 1 family protein
MRSSDGRAVVINRGWVPLDYDSPPLRQALPPPGTVRVTGVIFPSQKRGRFGPKIPPMGALKDFFRIDLPRLQRQLPYRIVPVYVHELSQDPGQSMKYPIAEALPRLEEGPHLSYAIQWFAFALIAIAGHAALLRKTIR